MPQKRTKAQIKKLVEIVNASETMTEAATKLGKSVETLSRDCARLRNEGGWSIKRFPGRAARRPRPED